MRWRPRVTPHLFAAVGVFGIVMVAGAHHGLTVHVQRITGIESASRNCAHCHVLPRTEGPLSRFWQRDYLSPLQMAMTSDGSTLIVTAEEADALLVVDVARGTVVDSIPVGAQPHSVVLDADDRTAYVTNRRDGTVSLVDLHQGVELETFDVGTEPAGLVVDRASGTMFVANSNANEVVVFDLDDRRVTRRLSAGQHPYTLRATVDGQAILVTNRITDPVPYRTPPRTEFTIIDRQARRVTERITLDQAHIVEGVAVTPDGSLALATIARPKNLLPATQVGRGWMMTFGLAIIDLATGDVAQVLLDDVDRFYADPYDVVITPDGQRAFVTHAGADVVTAIDLAALRGLVASVPVDRTPTLANDLTASQAFVLARIPTGANPKGMVMSPDGTRLYVAERLADRVAVIDVANLSVVDSIVLGTEPMTFRRHGQRLFHNAGQTYQGQFSCRSCHPEGHTDQLTYDLEPDGLGRNIVNNLSLRNLRATAPYKWTGKNPSLYAQCGYRFAKWLTRTEPYSDYDLRALVAYILSLEHSPNRYRTGETPAAQHVRGATLFERTVTNDGTPIPPDGQCVTCHPGPQFTDGNMADVGTGGDHDSQHTFDTPALNNLYETAPYLHDGRAATLEEIWTVFNPDDRHGVANDLSKSQLNDLIEYLKTLGGSGP